MQSQKKATSADLVPTSLVAPLQAMITDNQTTASSSAHDADTLRSLRRRTVPAGYRMPGEVGITDPKFIMCDQYGPAIKPAQIPLARALALFDIRLVHCIQKFHQKRASSPNGTSKPKALDWLADCNNITQQWEAIDSGLCQFSEHYMRSTSITAIWTEGMRIIQGVLRQRRATSNQSNKRDNFALFLEDYENLANKVHTEMIHAAQEGLLEVDFLPPIQERWMRLDETVTLDYDLGNVDLDEDIPVLLRGSQTWQQVRSSVQMDDRGARYHAGSKKYKALILWLAFFSCAVAPIPLFSLGYARSTHLQGTANDADFWFLILATATQIQGLLVSSLLEWERDSLPKWRWGIPAALAGASSIMAAALYVHVPTEWSSFLSLVAGTTQSFMISQFFLS